jgi:hypothetical protein
MVFILSCLFLGCSDKGSVDCGSPCSSKPAIASKPATAETPAAKPVAKEEPKCDRCGCKFHYCVAVCDQLKSWKEEYKYNGNVLCRRMCASRAKLYHSGR